MKGQAALLLFLLAVGFASSSTTNDPTTTTTTGIPSTRRSATNLSSRNNVIKKIVTNSEPIYSTLDNNTDSEVSKILSVDPKKILVENNRSEDEDANKEKQIQDELAKVFKAQAKKVTKPVPIRVPVAHGSYNTTDNQAMKDLLEAEDMVYNEDIDGDEYDDDDDEYADEYDDEDSNEDDITDNEEVMSGCPDYCRCVGQYGGTTMARCTKLLEDQGFGSGIANLNIENAGEIRLGPHALRKLGLRQLESISIVNTKIVELDRTAFDGLKELFVVNLTHNSLIYIHPDTFQNNSQLSLLTISDNPIKVMSSRRNGNDYILDAPSVTELDFSSNQVTRLPRRAFAKMTNLAYISLRNNKLSNVEKDLFAPLDSLVELDLSHNYLADLPIDLFKGKGLQTLRISGNSFTSLSSIRGSKITTLDVSMNQLKFVTKDDLNNVPNLDQLYLSSNNLKRIHQHAFSDLDQLTYLDLSNNNLATLTEHHFRANSRLQVLILSNNPELETLPVFRTNAQEFQRYSIYRFECENCGLTFIETGTFDAMPAMTRLNLARNKLTGLPKDLLSSMSALRELDLSRNRLEKLDDDIFHGATSLTKLSLAMNTFVSGLKVKPFLQTTNLLRLDLSYCRMERVWSETKVPLKSVKFLSLHKNHLTHVTLDELRAMPNLSGLDLSHNPLRCDENLSVAVQWLTDNNVTPTESTRAMGSMRRDFDEDTHKVTNGGVENSSGIEPISQWSELAKKLCDSWEGGPPARPVPKKTSKKNQQSTSSSSSSSSSSTENIQTIFDEPGPFKLDFSDDIDTSSNKLDSSSSSSNRISNDEKIEFAWNAQDQEYEELAVVRYREWYTDALWPAITVILITLAVLLLAAHLAVCMAKRRGRGPVIRTPMILRPNLVIEGKNCGLVYKPLQEEIATPHMSKRGSFYSSGNFHYDKIVPESV